MPKTAKSPNSVLIAMMEEYQLTAYSLSKEISMSNSAILKILKGNGKITTSTALRLAKYFDKTPAFWLDLQREADLNEAASDKDLNAILKGITKAKKPEAKPKAAEKVKPLKKTTLADKRKKAIKTPDSKATARKPKAK